MVVTREAVCDLGSYRQLNESRDGFQHAFARLLLSEPALRGRVLDVGCGPGLMSALKPLTGICRQLDGVDPSPDALRHPDLTERWQAPFESAPIPSAAYDAAFAYNVVEHIADPRSFIRTVHRVLRPGGVFWALTPHGRHPFCKLSRVVELLGAKWVARRKNEGINHYSAYYRLNRASQVVRLAKEFSFASARFCYMPNMQWDTYFPQILRWAPHLYDWALGTRWRPFTLILAYRLQRGE